MSVKYQPMSYKENWRDLVDSDRRSNELEKEMLDNEYGPKRAYTIGVDKKEHPVKSGVYNFPDTPDPWIGPGMWTGRFHCGINEDTSLPKGMAPERFYK